MGFNSLSWTMNYARRFSKRSQLMLGWNAGYSLSEESAPAGTADTLLRDFDLGERRSIALKGTPK